MAMDKMHGQIMESLARIESALAELLERDAATAVRPQPAAKAKPKPAVKPKAASNG